MSTTRSFDKDMRLRACEELRSAFFAALRPFGSYTEDRKYQKT